MATRYAHTYLYSIYITSTCFLGEGASGLITGSCSRFLYCCFLLLLLFLLPMIMIHDPALLPLPLPLLASFWFGFLLFLFL